MVYKINCFCSQFKGYDCKNNKLCYAELVPPDLQDGIQPWGEGFMTHAEHVRII
jgi:hypothetical protein